jgi:hypothetical protein
MNELASVVMEVVRSEISNSEADMRSISALHAMNFGSQGNSNASTEVSVVFSILGVDEYFGFITMIVLLCAEECVFEETLILVPPVD